MKALVTGGAGFIGSHIVDFLIDKGWQVIVVDNESADCNDHYYWNPVAENFKLDICDYLDIRPLFNGVDYVFHLAAESRLQPAIENPILATQKNCIGAATVLQSSMEACVKRVVFSSTSSAYGRNPWPNEESQPNDCLNAYSASKVYGEQLSHIYYRLHGLETIVLRYFNVFGERSPIRGSYAPVVGIFLDQHRNDIPLTVVGDGSQRRDFIYVQDVARFNYLAAIAPSSPELFERHFNVGSGSNVSVLEIAEHISSNIEFLPPRLGEAATTLASIDDAKSVFGWTPSISILEWLSTH